MDDFQSDINEVKCRVPAFQTDLSTPLFYNVFEDGDLEDQLFVADTGTTDMADECAWIKSDVHEAMLTDMKFYIESFTDKSLYADHLVWQASNDFTAETPVIKTLYTVGQEMHEGWNYFKNPETAIERYS